MKNLDFRFAPPRKLLWVLFLSMVFSSVTVYAQDNFCYTPDNYPNFLNATTPTTFGGGTDALYVHLNFHIITLSDGTGGRTVDDIYDAVEVLYDHFSPHNIFFHVDCIDFIADDLCYDEILGAFFGFASNCLYLPTNPNVIDIFVLSENGTGFTGGQANGIPSSKLAVKGTKYLGGIPHDVLKSPILSHEVGHCLGLFHTHHGTCESGCPELVIQPTDPNNPDYNNCLMCGDFVCDTNASSELNTTPQEDCNDVVVSQCFTNPNLLYADENGNTYIPQVNNIMSSAPLTCQDNFTLGQGERIREHILQHPTCQNYSFDNQINISNMRVSTLPLGTTTWDIDIKVWNKVIVPAGATLQIENVLVQFESERAGIEVREGGKLIVNNSILEKGDCISTNWRGIRVAGDNSQPQPDPATFNPETDFSPHHGIAYLKNNSVVRDAKIGVSSGDGDDYTVWAPIGTTQPNFGGIIVAENTTFENNETALFFAAFGGFYTGNDISSVKACQFLFNDTYAGTYETSIGFPLPMGIATIGCLHSQAFTGNRFENFLTSLPIEEQGVGILNIFSPMQIGEEDNSSKGNHFVNLFEGVVNASSLSLHEQLRVFDNYFDGVQKGITVINGEATVIAGNTFTNIKGGTNDNGAFGLFADGCNNLDIYANSFDCPVLEANFIANSGVIIRNSGSEQDSRLFDNVFTGNFGIANRFEGKNERLFVDCNQYHNPIFWDWAILNIGPSDFLANQGVCETDFPELARRNSFHEILPGSPGNNYNIFNATAQTLEYRAQSADLVPDLIYGVVNALECSYLPGTILTDHCAEEGGTGGDPDFIHGRIAASNDEEEKTALYSQLIHARLDERQISEAKSDMVQQNRPISDKILAATYIDEQKADSVLTILGQLSLNTASDAAFYALCMERLNGIVPPAGSGKTMGEQEKLLRETASETDNTASAYAEALIAGYFMEHRPKNPLEVALPNIHKEDVSIMEIYPNPANNLFRIATDGTEFDEIQFTALDGTPIQTISANKTKRTYDLSVVGLPTGIYFCNLMLSGRIIEAKKIIVIK